MAQKLQAAPAKTQNFYDRIADVHNLALKINGYRASVTKYLNSLDLDIDAESYVLDAGSGTGIVTLGFQDTGFRPKKTIALDLSLNSLKIAQEQFEKERSIDAANICSVQGNVLEVPPLDAGLRELARLMKPGAKLVFIPVKPSLVGSVLELLYKFKIHPLDEVRRISKKYFRIVGNHEFPISDPIGWSKTIFLLEKP
jgi:ubiquinone/menaquinone biosynthesis C-methylase UbiE